MKLYPNLCQAVVDTLDQIFAGNKYADKVIEKTLKQNPKWGARDRRFIAETTYDIVRWYRLLQFVSQAGDHDFWKLLGAWCIRHEVALPAWNQFSGLDEAAVKERFLSPMPRSVKHSIPGWMDTLGEAELGSRWERELEALNREAAVVLRANTLKTSKDELQRQLASGGIGTKAIAGYPEALVLERRQNIFGSPLFRGGFFEVQDAASQEVAPFLCVEPGHRVIDACAGAGGKTLHLAALMHNKGRIIAMDTEAHKLDELKKRARRAGAGNIETRPITSSKTIKRLAATADRLLLDVPCSGLGVLRRNPDAKWKLSAAYIERVKILQLRILNDYSTLLKPGGLLVYSTCSLLPEENERQVQRFLSENGGFELMEEKHLWPSDGSDGFYMALIRKI